jgi:PAS domain S-box-containing protein
MARGDFGCSGEQNAAFGGAEADVPGVAERLGPTPLSSAAASSPADRPVRRSFAIPLVIYLSCALLVTVVGFYLYASQRESDEQQAREALTESARFRAGEIAGWLAERQGDANALAQQMGSRAALDRWLAAGHPDDEDAARLREHLRSLNFFRNYSDIALADPAGALLLSANGPHRALEAGAVALVRRAAESGSLQLSLDQPAIRPVVTGPIYLAVPVHGAQPGRTVVGLLTIDPALGLLPRIEGWPGASRNAQSYLIERHGGDMRFVSQPRLSRQNLRNMAVPDAARLIEAARPEETGFVAGNDYRGVPTLAGVAAVPGTPWYVVSGVDANDVYAPVRQLGVIYALLIVTVATVGGLMLLMIWRRREIAHLNARHEADLRRLEIAQRFEFLSRRANDIILLVDANGRIAEANDRALATYGFEREELIGKDAGALHPLFSRSDLADHGVLPVRREQSEALFESIQRRKDGTLFPVEISMGRVELEGRAWQQLIIRDITERKEAEQAVRETARRLRQVSETIDEVFWVADLNTGRLSYLSHAFTRLTNIDPEAMKADVNLLLTIIHPDDRPNVMRSRNEAIDRLQPYSQEYRIQARDGSQRWIWGRGFPVFEADGSVNSYVGVAQDITERREAEAKFVQAQKLETLGHLAGGIAHDFNNLLMAIQIGAQFAKEGGSHDHLDMVIHAAERGADLVRRLSSFSRHQELETRICDPGKLVRQSLKLVRTALPESISVEAEVDDSVSPASLDAALLESALLNLAINARDAMPDGGAVVLSARNVRRALPGNPRSEMGFVEIAVADTGDGMDEATRARALEPFFTTKESGKGTGLGLAMVHGFVTQSQGFMEIDSEVGKGTAIRMFFPAAEGAKLAAARRRATAMAEIPKLGTVLLVDDESHVRKGLEHLLRRRCDLLLVAASGPEALAQISALERLDVLLSDVVLPGDMSGFDLADKVLAAHPDCRVLLMSGYSTEARRAHSGREYRVLQKPFPPQTLTAALKELVS